ncbi:uncharacterized protein [Mobula birostris]|uniref:uncharacterized protein isoform X1 n=1 Tax=Mobula birostris TaxID=1983395 RepID=UPI003B27BBD0
MDEIPLVQAAEGISDSWYSSKKICKWARNQTFSIYDIEEVRADHHSEVTLENRSDYNFSIIFKGRKKNLDLVANSAKEAQDWINGLNNLKKYYTRKEWREKVWMGLYPTVWVWMGPYPTVWVWMGPYPTAWVWMGPYPVLRDSDELLHGQISAGGSQQSQGLRQLSGLLTCCKIIHCSRFEGATSNQLLDEIVSFVKTTFDKLVQDSDTHFHPIAHPSSSSPTPTLCPPSHTPTVSPPHPLPPALPPQCL